MLSGQQWTRRPIPGAGIIMAAEWYYKVGDREFGPVPNIELVQDAAEGRITPETEVRKGPAGPWVQASKVASLFERAARVRGAVPRDPFATPSPTIAKDSQTAATVYFANRAGIRLKQVRITLRDGEAITEAGALHFMLGRIEMESKIGGVAGIGRAMMNRFVTKEAAILPRYRGTGQIYLEPSFSHFLIHRLDGEEVIADRGMFYCGQGALEIGSAMQKNVSSAMFGGEGLFQTRIKGVGICVFESPVPADEVLRMDLKDETLRVDGNFALMRTGRIEFSVEKSTKGLLGTLTSGEGLLQTFRGTGSVWLAPTQDIYQRLQSGGIATLATAPRASNTNTNTTT
jgi:uncharacterized protein (AIM24 family)